jgi:hypothetical protein
VFIVKIPKVYMRKSGLFFWWYSLYPDSYHLCLNAIINYFTNLIGSENIFILDLWCILIYDFSCYFKNGIIWFKALCILACNQWHPNYKNSRKTLIYHLIQQYHSWGYTQKTVTQVTLYTMEFYAVMKKNKMLSFAGTWMELENIILSEVSLAQKTKNHMFSLICGH